MQWLKRGGGGASGGGGGGEVKGVEKGPRAGKRRRFPHREHLH